jgi:hypothetical protein
MCCFVLVLALLGPRIAILATWLFSDQLSIAFESFWIGAAGFVFLPWTTVMYAWCYQPLFGVQGFGWFLVAFGFAADLATWFGGAQRS